MDFALTPEQALIAETARKFVEREIHPLEDEVEKTGVVRPEVAAEIRRKVLEMGFYAPNFPAEVGGGGLSNLELALLERELGRGSMALTHFWGRPQNILMACQGAQRERYLLPAVRGEKMDALAITEPGAGSDIRSMRCAARKSGRQWILNGSKHFISGAEWADFVIVFAATGEEKTPNGARKKITAFLVDRETPGFEIRPGYQAVGHRGYSNSILTFDDCALDESQALGQPDRGFAVMNEWLFATRITVAAMAVGRARRIFDLALRHAAEREQFGRPIGKFQGVGFQLADMITEIDAADFLALSAAWRLDQKLPANREIASAKLFATETLAKAADAAVQIHGGMGLMADLPLERFWRDARVERIWDGTSEIQRHIISRELLRPLGA